LYFRKLIFLLFLFVVTAFSNIAVYGGQFTGEDESNQWVTTIRLIYSMNHGDIGEFGRVMLLQDQPPLRYLLSIPGVMLWPHTEFGLRLVAILFSFVMTYQLYRLGVETGGEFVGVWSSLLIAASGVYNWTSMAFGWSITVVCMILVIRMLRSGPLLLDNPDGKKRFVRSNLLVMVMFLVNTGNILFFFTLSAIVLWMNRKNWKQGLFFTGMAALYYACYYIVFFGLAARFDPAGEPVGQLAHNLQRSNEILTGIGPLVANLQGINAYFFPYLAWLILGLSLFALVKRERIVLAWLSLYLLAWTFLFSVSTAQYFLLFFIAVFPFGLVELSRKLHPRQANFGYAFLLILVLLWNQQLFINRYGSDDPDYPTKLIRLGSAEITRQHNIYEPYTSIVGDLKPILRKGNFFVADVSGSFTTFYYRKDPVEEGDGNYAGLLESKKFPVVFDAVDQCYQPGWVTSMVSVVVTKSDFCLGGIEKIYSYPRSKIRVYLLNISQ
jgi:hypothetical protein